MTLIFFALRSCLENCPVYITSSEVRWSCEKKSNQIHLFPFWRQRLRFPSVCPHKSVVKSFSRPSSGGMNGCQLNSTQLPTTPPHFSMGYHSRVSELRVVYNLYIYHLLFKHIQVCISTYMFLLCVCFEEMVVFFFSTYTSFIRFTYMDIISRPSASRAPKTVFVL